MDLSHITGINIPILSAFLLGLITAIAPCPMTTNIAAVAYISRQVTNKKYAVFTGGLYTLGRMFSYSLLGIVLVVIGAEITSVSSTLQVFGERVLGPFLIAVGLFLLFADRFSFGRGSGLLASMGGKVAGWGMWGGFLLGALFALAFCPYSAVLYFGILIPLAIKTTGGLGLPAIYAIGTGLPVLIFASLLSAGISQVSNWLNAVNRVEKVIRILVSLIFIGAGIYLVVQWLTVR